jgi:hypothetical protein
LIVKLEDRLTPQRKEVLKNIRKRKRRKNKPKSKPTENLTEKDFRELMGMNRDTYKRGPGGSIRKR